MVPWAGLVSKQFVLNTPMDVVALNNLRHRKGYPYQVGNKKTS